MQARLVTGSSTNEYKLLRDKWFWNSKILEYKKPASSWNIGQYDRMNHADRWKIMTIKKEYSRHNKRKESIIVQFLFVYCVRSIYRRLQWVQYKRQRLQWLGIGTIFYSSILLQPLQNDRRHFRHHFEKNQSSKSKL